MDPIVQGGYQTCKKSVQSVDIPCDRKHDPCRQKHGLGSFAI